MGISELSSEKRRFFRERGYLRLEQAVSKAQLRPLQERIAHDLARRGIGSSGRGIPKSISELPVFQQIGKLSQLVNIPDLEAAVIPPDLGETVNALASMRVTSRQSQLLLSPPKQGDWSLDRLNWHTDVSSREARMPGIQAFVIVDDLEERGGATLVLSGSHLRTSSAQANSRVRDALRRGEDGEATLRELGLTIVELSGKSGDVYLMDMRILHTPSVNTSTRLRIVATVRYFLE